jgi:predicted  nucleic acid-binding Zn-ribbon protein
MNIKSLFPVILLALALLPGDAAGQASKTTPKNQLAQTRSDLIVATQSYKESAQEVVKFQEQEVATATAKVEQLRQLVADGLIALNELAAGEQEVAAAKAKLESTKKQIAESDSLIAQIRDAEVAEKTQAKAQAAQSRPARSTSIHALQRHGRMGTFKHIQRTDIFHQHFRSQTAHQHVWTKCNSQRDALGPSKLR